MKRCEVGSFVNLVNNTWNNGKLNNVINSVFKKIKKVLVLILEANGGNDLVKKKNKERSETN